MAKYFKELSSADPQTILAGIETIRKLLKSGPSQEDLSLMFDALTSLFYIDPFDRPDLQAVVSAAQETVAGMGAAAIPLILDRLENTDLKAELVLAQTCGLMGEPAIEPLVQHYENSRDPLTRAFILYAFGKIRSPRLLVALPLVLQAVRSPSRELEDTAVRALGKLCENISPEKITESERDEIFNLLLKKLTHPSDVIRAKAVRSLGKLVRRRYLNPTLQSELEARLNSILGLGGETRWDYAYIVRREAQEVLKYIPRET